MSSSLLFHYPSSHYGESISLTHPNRCVGYQRLPMKHFQTGVQNSCHQLKRNYMSHEISKYKCVTLF